MKYDIELLRAAARERLSEKRYRHTCGVEAESARLALIHGADENKARAAALLHDIEKETDTSKQLKMLGDWGIIVDKYYMDCPQLLHSLTGAETAARAYMLEPELCEAIRRHTAGSPEFGIYGMILYIADYTEQSRQFSVEKDIASVRELSYESLEKAVARKAANVLAWETSKNRVVHPDTLATYNEFVRYYEIEKN